MEQLGGECGDGFRVGVLAASVMSHSASESHWCQSRLKPQELLAQNSLSNLQGLQCLSQLGEQRLLLAQ